MKKMTYKERLFKREKGLKNGIYQYIKNCGFSPRYEKWFYIDQDGNRFEGKVIKRSEEEYGYLRWEFEGLEAYNCHGSEIEETQEEQTKFNARSKLKFMLHREMEEQAKERSEFRKRTFSPLKKMIKVLIYDSDRISSQEVDSNSTFVIHTNCPFEYIRTIDFLNIWGRDEVVEEIMSKGYKAKAIKDNWSALDEEVDHKIDTYE